MSNFSDSLIQKVWEKALTVEGYNSKLYRKDVCGAWIKYSDYGKETDYGWTIDHVYPTAKGGKDDFINLRPMHWKNNHSKGNDYPTYKVVITSDDERNIMKEQSFTVNEELQQELKKLYNI